MEPGNLRFGGGASGTLLHPLVAVVAVLCVIMILRLPLKSVIAPLILALFLIPKGQVVVAAGVHFNVYRIIILAGLARLAVSRRSSPLVGGFNFMDRVVTLWAVSLMVIFSVQYSDSQAIVKALGDLLDALGGYFVLRFLIRDREDVRYTLKMLVIVAAVNAICMLNEQRAGTNLFALLGGAGINERGAVSETVRNGKIRSQGAFEVFILAGTFGATLLPLTVWLWSEAKYKMISFLGMLAATVMMVTCNSSTTLGAYGAGIFALCLWPLRRQMRLIRWGIAAAVVGLHLVMNGPVWSLIEKIDLTGSSESYHRYKLIDNCITHFGDWWLLGTSNNGSWGWMMHDLSNAYVMYAINGGLATCTLFIAIISRGFGGLGTARKLVAHSRREEWFVWCLGAALFSHVVAFFGIGYFDQMQFAWFALLAFISVAVFEAKSAPTPQAALASAQTAVNWDMMETNQ